MFEFSGNYNKIVLTKEYFTRNERGHITQFFNDELERLGEKCNLEFHYEYHHNDEGRFIRLCCHIRPYGEHKNYKSKADYTERNSAEVVQLRHDLAVEFKHAFANKYHFIAVRYNYLGLIRKDIETSVDSEILQECEQFISDTLPTVLSIIVKIYGT